MFGENSPPLVSVAFTCWCRFSRWSVSTDRCDPPVNACVLCLTCKEVGCRFACSKCALWDVRSKGVKLVTIFGQNVWPQFWSKLRPNHSSSYIKRSPGSWGYSPKTQGCVLYTTSYDFDQIWGRICWTQSIKMLTRLVFTPLSAHSDVIDRN